MAKKKSKNKRKKLAKARDNGSVKEALGANLRQAGTVAAAAIVGEIVAATIERLTQKAGQSQSAADDSNGTEQHAKPHKHSAIEGTTSKLQDGLEDVKPTVREATETIRDSFGEIRPTLTDVADSLKEAAQETLQRSLAIANPAEMTVERAVDTAKNIIGSANKANPGKSDKKSKKKNKKKA